MLGNANYFSRRANEERIAAMKAAHPNARSAHLQMAERYTQLARSSVAYRPPLIQKLA
jgi:hypothetical protein